VRFRPEGGPILQFSSQYIQLLKLLDGAFVVTVPFVAGVRPRSPLFNGIQSVWDYLKGKLGDDVPPLPDLETNDSQWTVTIPGKPPYWYTVRQGIPREDWLSVRAERHYGDMLLWPLIFEATRTEERKLGTVRFVNQNKLWAGQKIFVPDISGFTPEQRAAARARGRDWKRVG
jgi:nucleoid-associated protein YgaU